MMANKDSFALSHSVDRDLRLDLFRGMGLWMIFLDHIPHDIVAWLTLRNYGFSDAAEFFVFISGYLLGYIYGPIVSGGNFLAATKRLVMRAWQMYVAHILLFLIFVTGGFFFYVLLAVFGIAFVGYFHYLLWGHSMTIEVEEQKAHEAAAERERVSAVHRRF